MENKNINQRERHTAGGLFIREREDGQESRTISGYAIVFNEPSAPLWENESEVAREVIAPAAISRELLDKSDIKMTMFHDRTLILARSKSGQKSGEGSLSYDIDEKGVSFSFEAPNTADGNKALELVRRGDLAGCSFCFDTYYGDENFVKRSLFTKENNKREIIFTVNRMLGIYDFTIAADPYYSTTEVQAREKALVKSLRDGADDKPAPEPETPAENENMKAQVAEMLNNSQKQLI